jgi:hypothetical protein
MFPFLDTWNGRGRDPLQDFFVQNFFERGFSRRRARQMDHKVVQTLNTYQAAGASLVILSEASLRAQSKDLAQSSARLTGCRRRVLITQSGSRLIHGAGLIPLTLNNG